MTFSTIVPLRASVVDGFWNSLNRRRTSAWSLRRSTMASVDKGDLQARRTGRQGGSTPPTPFSRIGAGRRFHESGSPTLSDRTTPLVAPPGGLDHPCSSATGGRQERELPRAAATVRVGAMETRRLGRLDHRSSVLIYGAAALSDVTQDVADRSIQEALDGGINHVDVAASYGDAELRLGPWMSQIRTRIFLATKTGQRDRESAWREINASLERLQTDRVDLIQAALGRRPRRAGPGHRSRRRAGGGDPGPRRGPRGRGRDHRPRLDGARHASRGVGSVPVRHRAHAP